MKQWNVADVKVERYYKAVVLDASNDYQCIVSFAFQTGRYGPQVFQIEPAGPHPPCGPYESPVFSVVSCNRHPPRSPMLQAQAGAAIAAQQERAKQQHLQMLQHQARQVCA